MSHKEPIIVVVDGIIGAGKTTLIRDCLIPILTADGLHITEVREPVEEWKSSGRLAQFYADPTKRGYQFQTRAFHDRVRECQRMYAQYISSEARNHIFMLERSIFTDRIFIKVLLEEGHIDSSEYEDYLLLWTMWEEVMPFRPDLFVYLRPSIDTCMKRINERAREGESVSKEYQERLLKYHDEFLGGKYADVTNDYHAPVIHIKTDSNFRDDSNVKFRLAREIGDFAQRT